MRPTARRTPVKLNLRRGSRLLEVSFDDGARFELPCEYLRVFSPAAETPVMEMRGGLVSGKEGVNIDRIEPVGSDAVRLHFDDGHDSGVYSWDTLYELGQNRAQNRDEYRRTRVARTVPEVDAGPRTVRVLYFATLASRVGRESETLELPEGVTDVRGLVAHLAARGGEWSTQLAGRGLKMAVDKQFATPDMVLTRGAEVALVGGQLLGTAARRGLKQVNGE